MDPDEMPGVSEIAAMLDHCTPEELSGILRSIHSGSAAGEADEQRPGRRTGSPQRPPPMTPTPPSGPAPASSGRRPPPPSGRPGSSRGGHAQRLTYDGEAVLATGITMSEVQDTLRENVKGVLREVHHMKTSSASQVAPRPQGDDVLSVELLSKAFMERNSEMERLDSEYSAMRNELLVQDTFIAELSNELEMTLREVRHRRLDLELHQLKLEERIRSNAELEQIQRNMSTRIEELGVVARHAELAAASCSSSCSPSGVVRAQGSLPWTLRLMKQQPVQPAFVSITPVLAPSGVAPHAEAPIAQSPPQQQWQ